MSFFIDHSNGCCLQQTDVPNAIFDLPLNLLTKRFSGKVMLPLLMTGWGTMSILQVVCKDFAAILVVRLILA